jgi:hypothetical protein
MAACGSLVGLEASMPSGVSANLRNSPAFKKAANSTTAKLCVLLAQYKGLENFSDRE